MSVEHLVGSAKLAGDLHVDKHKIRWNDSTTILPGQIVRLRLPRYDDRMLDLRNLFMCFYLQGSSADPNARLDGSTIQTLVDRIRILSGSVVLADMGECSLLFQSLYDLNTEVNTSSALKYQVGDMSDADKIAAFALAAPGRQYIAKLAPRDSLLNCDAVLPVGRCSELTVELTFTSAAKSIYSPLATAGSTWIITNFELHCDYIQSNVLSSHFNTNPFRISVTDYSQRLNTLLSATTGQIRWGSAYSSLDKVYTILRDGTTSQALSSPNKARVAKPGDQIMYYNVLSNNVWLFEDDVLCGGSNSYEGYEEMKDTYPQIATAAFFSNNNFFNSTQNRIGVNFQSAPAAFRKELQSGARTSGLNTDIILQVQFAAPMTARVDSFLSASV